MSVVRRFLAVAAVASVARAHGSHGHVQESAEDDAEWAAQGYAAEHMHKEHHIDSFDLASFFQLHDLNQDGVWDAAEIEAVYGVHHEYAKALSPSEEAQKAAAEAIVKTVLLKLDNNHDGYIQQEEFEAGGWKGLESFKALGAEGHHYDVESEFFLHHEEVYHGTPEDQTDESYVHAEDLEHFARHEQIELEEENKERAYQGLPPIKKLSDAHKEEREEAQQANSQSTPAHADGEDPIVDQQDPLNQPPAGGPDRKQKAIVREVPPERQPPAVRYRDAPEAAKEKPEWGEGEAGYQRPKDAADKLRKNMPYKYRFKRNWGDF